MQFIDLEQGSDAWHATRKLSIGSSDASVIMGCDPYRDIDALFLEKTGKVRRDFKTNEAMELGKKWEGAAREYFNIMLDFDVQPRVGRSDLHPCMLASFDGICDSTKTLVEIKYTGERKLLEALDKGPPEHHFAQMQHQLAVSGYASMWYIPYVLVDKRRISRIEYLKIPRDDKYIENLITHELEFYQRVLTATRY